MTNKRASEETSVNKTLTEVSHFDVVKHFNAKKFSIHWLNSGANFIDKNVKDFTLG